MERHLFFLPQRICRYFIINTKIWIILRSSAKGKFILVCEKSYKTISDHPVPDPCHDQGHFAPSQLSPSLIQPKFGHFQGSRGSHSCSGNVCQGPTTFRGKNFFPIFNPILRSSSLKPDHGPSPLEEGVNVCPVCAGSSWGTSDLLFI